MTATRSDLIERVSTLELFLDLVFVFTITQLTAALAHDPDPLHLGSPAQRAPSARLAARVLFRCAGEGRGAH
ncbi:MAG TPA: low temperature requirement protein A [Propionibacteriaceae bacterium]|nr:low temperature requirement protein A [Propionibacteriaceae bacterium]